ncbi:MAG: hypothetical protein CMI58_04175, partial [Parcubacteria group bacterium]|nr:hypothetical protein [Parcubacteria group bacterium]
MRDLIARGLKDLLYHKKEVGNTAILFSSQILVLIVGLGIKTIQVRALNPEDYGLLALFGTITSVIVLFFHYASFSSLKVILANNTEKQKEKEFVGLGILIAGFLGILFSATLFSISCFVDNLLHAEIGNLLMFLAPFCFILPFQFFISEISIGTNKLKQLAIFHLFSRLLFIASLLVFFKGDLLNVKLIIILNLLAWLVSTIVILIGYKPSFSKITNNFEKIKEKNKSFGFFYYFGAIINQSTYKLDELFITYFINITQLGFYTL